MVNLVNRFDKDITENVGYFYTTKASLSSLLANKRLTEFTKTTLKKIENQEVIDVGCGDGTYTEELFCWGNPKLMVGVDLSRLAINLAKKKFSHHKKMFFKISDCSKLPFKDKSFDIAIARGLLHHTDSPYLGIKEICRVSKKVLILEPNGYNIFLKLVEKFSSYHRAHNEKSFAPKTVRSWINKMKGEIVSESYIGLVPFFCPTWLAKILMILQPLLEKMPILRNCFCAVYGIFFVICAKD